MAISTDIDSAPVATSAAKVRRSRTHLRLLGFAVELKAAGVILQAYLLSRLMVCLIVLISSATIPMRAGDFLYSNPNNVIMDGLVRDDSWWYHNIATRGYNPGNLTTGEQGNIAFFPLYPLFVKMFSALVGNVFLGGILVSNLAFLIALCFLYALVKQEWGEDTAARTLFYYAAAPTAVFFSAMYTESLYMLLVIATFYFARNSQWDRAALTGALASCTRNTGILLAVVIVLEGLHQQGVRWWPGKIWRQGWQTLLAYYKQQLFTSLKAWRALIAGAFVPAGLIGYMAYLANSFGDPLGFIHVQATWGREVGGNGFGRLIGDTLKNINAGSNFWAGSFNADTLLNALFTLACIPLIGYLLVKFRPAYAIYCLATFLVPLSTGSVGSMSRYILMLIPCFILLGIWGKRSWVERTILAIFLPLFAYYTILFCHWYFAG